MVILFSKSIVCFLSSCGGLGRTQLLQHPVQTVCLFVQTKQAIETILQSTVYSYEFARDVGSTETRDAMAGSHHGIRAMFAPKLIHMARLQAALDVFSNVSIANLFSLSYTTS